MGNPLLSDFGDLVFYSFDPLQDPERVISNLIFHRPTHLRLQASSGWRTFVLQRRGVPVLELSVHVAGHLANSPFRAPFGSIYFAEAVEQPMLTFFLTSVLQALEVFGAEAISIVHYPETYHPAGTRLLISSMQTLAFDMRGHLTSMIEVGAQDYAVIIKPSARQKLRKAKATCSFRHMQLTALDDVYGFIESCRLARRQSLSMSLNDLQRTVSAFPGSFFLFEVRAENARAAAAVVIRINDKILYTFYYAHHEAFDKISPVIFLLAGIYSFAQANGYRWIDLGTSMNGQDTDASLLHFKQSVGGQPSMKYFFERKNS